MSTPSIDANLVAKAMEAQANAYVPHSGMSVGAALLTTDGQIITGCNVENDSYGLTICAERCTVFSAIACGVQEFQKLAVASPGGLSPCGACRQVLAQFCHDLPILVVDSDNAEHVKEVRLKDLLPATFRMRDH